MLHQQSNQPEQRTITLRWLVGLEADDDNTIETVTAHIGSNLWHAARHAQPGDTIFWNGKDGSGFDVVLTAQVLAMDGHSVKER